MSRFAGWSMCVQTLPLSVTLIFLKSNLLHTVVTQCCTTYNPVQTADCGYEWTAPCMWFCLIFACIQGTHLALWKPLCWHFSDAAEVRFFNLCLIIIASIEFYWFMLVITLILSEHEGIKNIKLQFYFCGKD